MATLRLRQGNEIGALKASIRGEYLRTHATDRVEAANDLAFFYAWARDTGAAERAQTRGLEGLPQRAHYVALLQARLERLRALPTHWQGARAYRQDYDIVGGSSGLRK